MGLSPFLTQRPFGHQLSRSVGLMYGDSAGGRLRVDDGDLGGRTSARLAPGSAPKPERAILDHPAPWPSRSASPPCSQSLPVTQVPRQARRKYLPIRLIDGLYAWAPFPDRVEDYHANSLWCTQGVTRTIWATGLRPFRSSK
jgi:hypothetical protein